MVSPSPAITLLSVAATVSVALYVVKQRAGAKPVAAKEPATTTFSDGKKWDADELIKHRRSIFPQDYDKSRKVSKEILEKILESANWAPTHARTEPWRFIVFSTPEALQRLGQFEADLYKKMVPPHMFMEKKYKKKIEAKLDSSYVIAICMKRQESEKLPEIEEVCATACAVQNLHLSAAGHGVGGYWSSGPPIFSNEMKEFLGLGEKDKCLGLFYVGYPKPGHVAHGARKSIKDKVQWVTK
jgi:nitroreductase|uniref:Nitroreductase domain-containing protein n=1 Tax=Globisporangium ultimum (strain ATCC 200006 / CBS 805.95 / DAOM BR144) TaxID=431595 RepID=K3XA83_GLOUD